MIAVVNGILTRVERTHSQIARLVSSGNIEEASLSFQDEALTDAESRVAVAVSRGLSNKEIAAQLDISVRTVENHISHILEKKVLAIAWKSRDTCLNKRLTNRLRKAIGLVTRRFAEAFRMLGETSDHRFMIGSRSNRIDQRKKFVRNVGSSNQQHDTTGLNDPVGTPSRA